jgi:hypothetical protein
MTVESSMGSETKNKNSLSPQNNVSWQQFWPLRNNSSLHLCNKYLFNYVMNWSFNFYRGNFFPEQIFFAIRKRIIFLQLLSNELSSIHIPPQYHVCTFKLKCKGMTF